MKKTAIGLAILSAVVFVIAWGMIGVKILNTDYSIEIEAHIGYIALVVFFICFLYVKSTNRCPHCGKVKVFLGKYCPHCGKEIR